MNMEIPDSLEYRLKLYRAKGMILNENWRTFHEPSWLAVLSGYKIYSDTYDPIVDVDHIKRSFDKTSRNIREVASNQALHNEFIAKYFHSLGMS